MTIMVNSFVQQVDCDYESERYSVRDNGAIYRHARLGKQSRAADETWTFGQPKAATGYLELASVRVHRIVATAFYGAPPTRHHVVDHIDTNRHNNRPENLRWVTRLENVLFNPITAKRIAFVYGSVEAFLADPRMPPINGALDTNFEWMRTVSPEEARLSLERLMHWATSDNLASGGTLGEWLYNRSSLTNAESEKPRDTQLTLVVSKSPGAVQRKWKVPAYFPGCPPTDISGPLEAYASNLKPRSVFSANDFGKSVVLGAALSPDKRALWVMCKFSEDSVKPWSLAKVTHEDGLFVHTSEGTFFQKEGAKKYFTLGRGLEWAGGEVFDDFC